MIVTREIINKSITFRDGSCLDHPYTYNDLSSLIDAYKNLLQYTYNVSRGETVLIGEQSGKTQLALVFACLELGLTLAIVDYGRKDDFQLTEYNDPKTNILLPIDYFILSTPEVTNKFMFFNKVCGRTIILDNETLSYTRNDTVYSTPDSILLKCTSSGTTGTPKLIKHSHEFIYSLVQRNSKFFFGIVGQAFNLSHGSSLATYFLPALVSSNVTDYINFSLIQTSTVLDNSHLDHLMLPYTDMVTSFLEEYDRSSRRGICLYTLSYIRDEWKVYHDSKKISDVISIFGSNETSGPTLINRISYINFDKQTYYKVDNFYDLSIHNNELVVSMPIYQYDVETKDEFALDDDAYFYLGRIDLFRINGEPFHAQIYQKYAKQQLECDLIFDFVRNEIYLAVWKDDQDIIQKVETINNLLKERSSNKHYISKYKVLDKDYFLSGVKLDNELLRDYFRNNV